jgi:hypothetical protein
VKKSLIEYFAEKYSEGNVKKELISRMKQFTNWELEEDDLIINEDPRSIEIIIDGTKKSFIEGDALDYIEDFDILDLLKVASFLGARLIIKPATKKTLSIIFYWDRL